MAKEVAKTYHEKHWAYRKYIYGEVWDSASEWTGGREVSHCAC